MKTMLRVTLLGVAVAAAWLVGMLVRPVIAPDNPQEVIRAWIEEFGFWAPLVYLTLLVFRHFLMIPATPLLVAGGLCFGPIWGGLLGTIGVTLTGMLYFSLARYATSTNSPSLEELRQSYPFRVVKRSTPLVVLILTALPTFRCRQFTRPPLSLKSRCRVSFLS